MTILMFSWRGPAHPNSGGAEIVTHAHLKFWAASGHRVTWFTSAFPGVPTAQMVDGIQVLRRGNQIITVYLHAFFWYLFSPHPKYDLVIDQFHGLPFFTPLYVRTQKLAFIHEVAREVWWSNHLRFPLNYILGAIGFFLEPLVFLLYRHTPFLTVSHSTRADLLALGIPAFHVTVIPNGVSSQFSDFPKLGPPTLIFLGALAKDKGITDALKVFTQIHIKNPRWQFWVVGKGEPSYLNQLHIPAFVKLWGFVPDPQKFELLAKASVLVNPSHREGWGLVNIEANSVGTPVVAYNVPGCRDSVLDGQTGLLCPPGDTDCLTQSTIRLITDPSRYQRLSTQAKSWARHFSWPKSTSLSLKFINRLVAL